MIVTYDYQLVLLSVAVAIISAHAGLMLLNSQGARAAFNYKLRIGLSAFVIGTGIWSMHFIGMLALHLPIVVNYAVLPTLLSVLIAITLTGIGLYAATCGYLGRKGWMIGALLMGGGICAMHYVGMEALKPACIVTYLPWGTVLSVLLGAGASGIALKIAGDGSITPGKAAYSSIVLGCAISAMHYSGILSTQFAFENNAVAIAVPVLNETYLACIVAISAFVLCEVALLTSLPSARVADTANGLHNAVLELTRPFSRAQAVGISPDMKSDPAREAFAHRRQYIQPAGQIERQFAVPPDIPNTPDSSCSVEEEDVPAEISIPVGGQSESIRVEQILFVAADGHYSKIGFLDAGGSFVSRFSKLSITQFAELAGSDTFDRVHRSYIVNLFHVHDCRRRGGNGQVRFKTPGVPPVPVSRSRYQCITRRIAMQAAAQA